MKDFALIPRTSGAFPNVVTVPDTSPGSKDGTPMHKNMFDDFVGFFQAAMNGAHLTPSGNNEAAGVTIGAIEGSQLIQALQTMFLPPGSKVELFTDKIPTGARLLKLNGQRVLRATYPRLVTAVEQAYVAGHSFYRCQAGGTPDASGTYLQLPDVEGMFFRARDLSKHYDPDGDTRGFGDVQLDAFEDHNHQNIYDDDDNLHHEQSADSGGAVNVIARGSGAVWYHTGFVYQDHSGGTPKANNEETRSVNTIVTVCIVY